MSVRSRVISVLVALVQSACGPSGSGDAPPGLLLRLMCGIERRLERDDFRVREEGVDRCAGAARQIKAGRERAGEVLRQTLDPSPKDERDGSAGEGDGES